MKLFMRMLLVVLSIFVCLAAYSRECNAGPLRLGVILPLSGVVAHEGNESLKGIKIAVDFQNEKGGLLGKKIELVISDAPGATEGAGEAERLITKEKVKLIMGTYSSSVCSAASEVSNRYEVPYFEVVAAVSDAITARGLQYVWRLTPRGSNFIDVAADFYKEVLCPKLGIAPDKLKIAIAYEDTLFGTTTAKYAMETLPKFGFTNIVANEAYSAKSVDLSSTILRMKAAQPDVFMAASYTPDAILLLRQAKELNFNVKVWQGLGGGWGTPDTYKALGKDLNYILNTEYAPVHINKNAVPGAEEFQKRYQQKYKEPLLYPVPQTAYMGALALFDIIKRAGSLEHEAIAKAAWETDIPLWTTSSGWGVKFFGPGKPHPGQNSRSFMYLTQWKDGSQHVLWPKSAQYSNPVIPLPTWQERDKK